MDKVRAVVLNYNQPEYTIQTIDYLARQQDIGLEIVVVDNKSTNDNYAKLKSGLSDDVILIRSEENLGYAKGNNLGCRHKSAFLPDYYFIVNNDVIIEDDYLISKLIDSINKNNDAKVVAASPLVNTISTGLAVEKQIQVRKVLPFRNQVIVNSAILNKIFRGVMNDFLYRSQMPFVGKYTLCDSINGCAFLIDSQVYERLGYMDEGTFLYYEEIILGQQLKDAGYGCVLDGFGEIKHLQGLSTGNNKKTINLFMEKEKSKSEIYCYKHVLNEAPLKVNVVACLRNIEIYIKYVVNSVMKMIN